MLRDGLLVRSSRSLTFSDVCMADAGREASLSEAEASAVAWLRHGVGTAMRESDTAAL